MIRGPVWPTWLAAAGTALAGVGFVLAGVRPGAGPRLVPGASELAGLYLPPVAAGAVLLLVAAVVVTARQAWAVVLAGVLAACLLVGSASIGLDGIVYRLARPADLIPFLADSAQLLGELLALVAGVRSVWAWAGSRSARPGISWAGRATPGGRPPSR